MRLRVVASVVVCVAMLAPAGTSVAQEARERTFVTEHFSITWTEGTPEAPDPFDGDSDGVPDAIEALASGFESARSFLLGPLGYRPPPGSDPYPLYVGSEGGYVRAAPGGEGDSRPSFIVIPLRLASRFTTGTDIRRFAVHEYMHAIQYGYDTGARDWIKEATAAWVEDVFDDAADPNHELLEGFVAYPRRSLDDGGPGSEYGAWLFFQFLTEYVGGNSVTGTSLIRELWERIAGSSADDEASELDAIDELVRARGFTFAQVWREFTLWRWRLGMFEEGPSYRAAVAPVAWPVASATTEVGAESCRLEIGELFPVSADYLRFLVARPRRASTAQMVLAVEGSPASVGFALVKTRGRPAERLDLTFDADGIATATLPDRERLARVTIGVGNASFTEETDLAYSLRASDRSRVHVSAPTGQTITDFGTAVMLAGTVTCGGEPARFADVIVTETAGSLVTTYRFVTGEDGRWTGVVSPTATSSYVVSTADPLLSQATSLPSFIRVRPSISIELGAAELRLGEVVTARGTIVPAHPGAQLVLEYRRPDGRWQLGDAETSVAGDRYDMSFVPPATGIWEVRVRMPSTADSDHVAGQSVPKLISVSD